ncbi:fgf-3 [Matsumuraeses phaseoli granulovirus]|uniref:Fgf-3 n=1 Tax=Matsumuraeses phaseoli granulovirus TaxID=2760664 RepID=A0AAE7SXT1_9BBAC|nr:fgf-3 [Matsumuraeses phaseoli granulovirus]QOD40089.1 fgf-3 [Matsumuraeses phaseoli granulovirus]
MRLLLILVCAAFYVCAQEDATSIIESEKHDNITSLVNGTEPVHTTIMFNTTKPIASLGNDSSIIITKLIEDSSSIKPFVNLTGVPTILSKTNITINDSASVAEITIETTSSAKPIVDVILPLIETKTTTTSTVAAPLLVINTTTTTTTEKTDEVYVSTRLTTGRPKPTTAKYEYTTVYYPDDEDDLDFVGEPYKYEQKMVRLFQYVNGEKLYLDTSNKEVCQYIVSNEYYPHNFLNLIQYTLEKNSEWDDDNQVVFQHEISLLFFCMNQCGLYYMAVKLSIDCIFVRELVQDVDINLEKIYLRKRFNKELLYVNMEYGQMNFKKYATMYSVDIDSNKTYNMTPVYDEPNMDRCSPNLYMHFVDEITEPAKEFYTAAGYTSTLSLPILIVCFSVSVLTLGALLIVILIVKYKRNKQTISY